MTLVALVEQVQQAPNASSIRAGLKAVCRALARHHCPLADAEATSLAGLFAFMQASPAVHAPLPAALLLSLPRHLRTSRPFFQQHLAPLWRHALAQSDADACMKASLLYNYRRMLPLRDVVEFCLQHATDHRLFAPDAPTALLLLRFLLQQVASVPGYRDAVLGSGLLERTAALWPGLRDPRNRPLLPKLLLSASLLVPSASIFDAPVGLVTAILDAYGTGASARDRPWLLRLLLVELRKTPARQYVLSPSRLVLAQIGRDTLDVLLRASTDLPSSTDPSFLAAHLGLLAAVLERWAELSISLGDQDEALLATALTDLLDHFYWPWLEPTVPADALGRKCHARLLHCLASHWLPWMAGTLNLLAFRNALVLEGKPALLHAWSRIVARDPACHWAFPMLFRVHPALVHAINRLLLGGRADWLAVLCANPVILEVLMDFVLDWRALAQVLVDRVSGHGLDQMLLLMLRHCGGAAGLQQWFGAGLDLTALLLARIKDHKNIALLDELFQTCSLAFDKELLLVSAAEPELFGKLAHGHEKDIIGDLELVVSVLAAMPAADAQDAALQLIKDDRSWREALHAVLFGAEPSAAARLLLFKAARIFALIPQERAETPDFGQFLRPMFEELSGTDLPAVLDQDDSVPDVDLVGQLQWYCKYGFESEASAVEQHLIEHLDAELLLHVLRDLAPGLWQGRRALAGKMVELFFVCIGDKDFLQKWSHLAHEIGPQVDAIYRHFLRLLRDDPGHSF